MAARRPPREIPADTPKLEAVDAPADEAPQEAQVDGVLVRKEVGPEGNLSVSVQPIGNVQITEVQTLLELGVRYFREQVGLDRLAGR